MQSEVQLVPMTSVEDFSDELAWVSMFRRHDPVEFQFRFEYWLTASGFDCPPEATVYDLLAALDDDRLRALGRTLFREMTKGGLFRADDVVIIDGGGHA
ncbi:MAG: hypothetical protein AAF282_05525 [Cyanobacteria bacterium P01_A01_bin.15]